MYGPFIVTYSNGKTMQFNETLERTKYLALLRTGVLGPTIERIETIEEWQRRYMFEKFGKTE